MKDIKHKRIPNSLRKYRKAKGLTQKDVVRVLGLKSTSMISRWENGLCLPSPMYIFSLALLYHVMADALFIRLKRRLEKDIHKAEQKLLQDES